MHGNPEQELRRRAEGALAATVSAPAKPSPPPVGSLVHELQVHQTELEMQNDSLRATELELQDARQRYQRLFDLAPIAYLTLDEEGNIREANFAAAQLLRMSRAALVGKRVSAFVEDKDVCGFHIYRRAILESSAHQKCEISLRCSDGTIFPARLESDASAQDSKLGHRIRMAIMDLTELKDALKRIESKAEETRLTLEASPVAMVMVDAKHRIRLFNAAAEQMFGYPRQELMGQSFELLMPEDSRTDAREPPKDGAHAPKMGSMEGTRERFGRRKNGSLVPLEISLSPFSTRGGGRVLAAIVDVSERKRLEEQVRHAQKMEAVGTLASGIAHDFNNLLMGIDGCASIAHESLNESSSARMYLQEILKATAGGAAIVRQLLAFTRRKPSNPSVFDLHGIIRGSERLLRRLLGEDIEAEINLGAAHSCVRFDPGQIEQVLMNLAVNARDALPTGGRLNIQTVNCQVTDHALALAPGEYILLTVGDSGIGMSNEVKARVFEPFFTTKPVGRGTGLGLSTVFGTITQAGGSITVRSTEGEGTTFEILLPTHGERSEAVQDHAMESGSLPAGQGTILLVEDDRIVRLVTKHYLESNGFHVLEASSGAEALECCRQYTKTIDLVLTDVVLPGVGGRELAAEITRIKPATRVLLMSAHSTWQLVHDKRLRAGTPILDKPFSEQYLLERIHKILRKPVTPIEHSGQRTFPF